MLYRKRNLLYLWTQKEEATMKHYLNLKYLYNTEACMKFYNFNKKDQTCSIN